MNILIIGSKGFIGSHCVNYFSQENDVWQCDVVTDYNLKQYFLVDATNADYGEVFQSKQFDVCINCSGAASVPDSIINPQRDFMLNTVNVFKQLDVIRKFNFNCKYINLSSAAVYGNPKYLPIDEGHPLNPISPYGVHKRLAESLCASFYENYRIKTCSIRIFSAYGEGLQKQLFWDLFQKAKQSHDVSLYGTGNETRDFIHINDITRAIDTIIKKAEFTNNIINVANGLELSIKNVAELFFDLSNTNNQIIFQSQIREGDPLNWVADITKLKKLGFTPQISLEKGLERYVKWLKENE